MRSAGLIVVMLWLLAAGAYAANAPARPPLPDTVKWAIWHEGCRIYAEDNSIGDADEIRECLIAVYPQDQVAQFQLRSASKGSLLNAIRVAARDIPAEQHLDQFFDYACKHEGLLGRFKEMRERADIEGIRTLYYETFKNNENARNLLAALSDEAVSDLVQSVR